PRRGGDCPSPIRGRDNWDAVIIILTWYCSNHKECFVEHMSISVLMADDHPVVREGMRAMIAKEPDMALVAEANDGAQAISLYEEHLPDVVLMDLRMPGTDGIAAIRGILAEHPEARVLALTSYEGDADIFR